MASDEDTKAAWESAIYNCEKKRKAHAALALLWQWVENEHAHFEYAMPDDFICDAVRDSLADA